MSSVSNWPEGIVRTVVTTWLSSKINRQLGQLRWCEKTQTYRTNVWFQRKWPAVVNFREWYLQGQMTLYVQLSPKIGLRKQYDQRRVRYDLYVNVAPFFQSTRVLAIGEKYVLEPRRKGTVVENELNHDFIDYTGELLTPNVLAKRKRVEEKKRLEGKSTRKPETRKRWRTKAHDPVSDSDSKTFS